MWAQGRGRWSLAGKAGLGAGVGVRQGSATEVAFEAQLKLVKVVGRHGRLECVEVTGVTGPCEQELSGQKRGRLLVPG